ncbi:MAG: metal ABC transporter substrate-binding protein, partial [Hyphomicrobiales bacterium]
EANSFQNQPYLDNQVKDRGFKLVSVGLTVNFPLGIYSSKYKSWAEVPDGATVAIQNDPTNGGRSLLLLQDKGAIKLKDGVGFKPSVADIVSNPKKLKIIEIEAAQTPRSLADVAAAAINTNYAVDAKIEPTSAILREDPKGPYVNLIAVREVDKDKPWVKALLASYHTPEIKAFVAERFKGSVLAGW